MERKHKMFNLEKLFYRQLNYAISTSQLMIHPNYLCNVICASFVKSSLAIRTVSVKSEHFGSCLEETERAWIHILEIIRLTRNSRGL